MPYQQLTDLKDKPLVVVLTGAGISAESGIPTFRDANGLWEGHNVMEVATPEGFAKNPELVLRFYNDRRAGAAKCQPNEGHIALTRLEEKYNVVVITQNVDDLHERAGSSHVLHLHGELRKVRSTAYPDLIYDYEDRPINIGDLCERGAQLRPHIVWFGESVPEYTNAELIVQNADYVIVVGTSMVVYPAAGLVDEVSDGAPIYVVNPEMPNLYGSQNYIRVPEKATVGVPRVVDELLAK